MPAALGVGAVFQQCWTQQECADPVDGRHPGPHHLLVQDEFLDHGEAGAAVFPGPVRGDPAFLRQRGGPLPCTCTPFRVIRNAIRGPVVAGNIFRFQAVLRFRIGPIIRGKTITNKTPHFPTKGGLFRCVFPIHFAYPVTRRGSRLPAFPPGAAPRYFERPGGEVHVLRSCR